MKIPLKEFFSFSKKELNGLIVFCFLLLVVAFAPFINSQLRSPEVYRFEEFEKEIAEFRASVKRKEKLRSYYTFDKSADDKILPAKYFNFNPNNLSEDNWHKLGLSRRQIKVIKNFEAKGGKFYNKESLKRIYSITPEDYARLEPYIVIPPRVYESRFESKSTLSEKRKSLVIVDLNSADSTELDKLPGIGPAFASRIIKYRSRLGGFHRKEQLLEVYGLDSAKFSALQNQVQVNGESIQKLNINSASFEDLKRHPYLSYKQMNAIIQYRKQHGNYRSIEDLKKLILLNETVIQKIEPYLSF